MTNRNLAPTIAPVDAAPIALHYVRKVAIGTGEATAALCGEQGAYGATRGSSGRGNGTSYTCPDCLIRYMLLPGGATDV